MMNLAEEDDWEYLPDAAAYRLLLRDELAIPLRSSPSVFNMDYFSTTSDTHLPPFIPLQFPPSPTLRANHVLHHQPDEEDVKINKVFFKSGFSAKESIESVDMKSSSSPTATSPRKTKSMFEFNDLFNEDQISRSLTLIKSDEVAKISDDVNWIGEGIIGDDYVDEEGGIIGGLNFWKLGFGGFGAICSFGVAAATLCLILFGNSHNHKAKQNHKLRFQIHSPDDQRMKQVATKFNEAMSAAVRGVPSDRAHITYGDYYDNAL